jgi:putative CocE/NonD family hydrolase
MTAPVVMIGGWRDIFLPWQIRDFEALQGAERNAWLTVGPWNHTSPEGSAEAIRQGLALFSADVRGTAPFGDRDRVRLYVGGGAGQWRDYPRWPPPGSREQRLFLHTGATLSASHPTAECAPTSYVYDPANATPAMHGPRLFEYSNTPDMSLLERRSDTVSFTSAPLTEDADVIGAVKVELYVRSSAGSTDFYACLCDLAPSGRPLHVVDGYVRLRARDAPADARGVRYVTLECWPTAYRFRRGHRVRLIIASAAHPRYARNLGTEEPIGTATRMVSSHQELFHGPTTRSAVVLTVCAPMSFTPSVRVQGSGSE